LSPKKKKKEQKARNLQGELIKGDKRVVNIELMLLVGAYMKKIQLHVSISIGPTLILCLVTNIIYFNLSF
jgi:hypothetical protein